MLSGAGLKHTVPAHAASGVAPLPPPLPRRSAPAPPTGTPHPNLLPPPKKRSARPIRPRSIRYGGSALGDIWAGGGGLLSAGRAVRAVQVATRGRKRPACPSFTFGAAHPHPHSPTPPFLAVPPHVRCAALRSIGGLPPPLPLRTDGAGFAAPVIAAGVAAALARLPPVCPAQGGREQPAALAPVIVRQLGKGSLRLLCCCCRCCWRQRCRGRAAGSDRMCPVPDPTGCVLSDVGHRIASQRFSTSLVYFSLVYFSESVQNRCYTVHLVL